MGRQIEISYQLFQRLEKLAVGFDTPESVIDRLVTFVESKGTGLKPDIEGMAKLGSQIYEIEHNNKKPRAITQNMAKQACLLGDSLFRGDISQDHAKRKLTDLGMNASSAHIYLYNFIAMRHGRVFKRSMKVSDIELFLEYILITYGGVGLKTALDAYEQHVLYAEDQGFATTKKRPMLDQMKKKLRRRRAE